MNGLNGSDDLPTNLQNDDLIKNEQLNSITESTLNEKSIETTTTTIREEENETDNNNSNLEAPLSSIIPSSVLVVNNLARPFTLAGLKKVLSKCGKIIDDKFWLNKDKTQCYVCYDNEQIADESKIYINNLKWPASNPNTLQATYGNLDELNDLIRKDEEEKIRLEEERKESARLEAIKQEERKQQLKEELSKKFNESLITNADILDGNSTTLIEQQQQQNENETTTKLNQSNNNNTNNENEVRERDISPAKNAESNVIHITNLERGFTVKQFKDLLNKFGKLIDEKFWIDRLKSQCYAVYESNNDALNARKQLHGLKWPRTNSKLLRVDFGKLADVNDLLNGDLKSSAEKTANILNNNNNLNDDKSKDLDGLNVRERGEQQIKESNDSFTTTTTNQKDDQSKDNLNDIKNSSKTRLPSPARNPISKIVYVRGLSRPFTRQQLKELLSQDGSYDEDRFWIDRVKSQCYAIYETEEIASKTRERLHRLTWPTGNHRRLVADFATEVELEEKLSINRLNEANKEAREQQKKIKDNERRASVQSVEKMNDSNHEREDRSGRYNEEMEFDHNQSQEHSSNNKRKRDRSLTPMSTKRDHRMESPREQYHKENHVKESPGKTLETLFRKTKTTPSIYWMPLDEEGMRLRDIVREKERIERLELEEQRERKKKERERFMEDRFRQNEAFNGRRGRSPPPARRPERSPYHPRHYGPPPPGNRNYPPMDRYAMMDKRPPPFRPPIERGRSGGMNYSDNKRMMDRPTDRPPQMRTPSRSPERIRRPRNSRSVSSHSSKSSRSGSSRSGPSPAKHSRDNKVRHSRSPVRRSRSPRFVDRRVPSNRR